MHCLSPFSETPILFPPGRPSGELSHEPGAAERARMGSLPPTGDSDFATIHRMYVEIMTITLCVYIYIYIHIHIYRMIEYASMQRLFI